MEVANTVNAFYQGWDVEAMGEAGDVANYAQTPSSPGFTAINLFPSQLRSPPQTQHNQVKVRTAGKSSRRRNPTVASYLGLGDSAEPAHLVKYAPTLDGQPPSQLTRKRRVPQIAERAPSRKKANADNKKASNQRRVSKNPRGAKHLNQSVTHKLDGFSEEPLPTPASTTVSGAIVPAVEHPRTDHQEEIIHNIAVKRSNALPAGTSSTNATVLVDDDDEFGQLCFDFEPSTHFTDDSAHPTHTSELTQHAELQLDEDNFDDDLMDDDLLELTTDTIDVSSSPKIQSSSPTKIYITDESLQRTQAPSLSPDTAVMLDEGLNSSGPTPEKFVSPVTLTTRLLAATGDEARKPIVRSAFPAAARDRSPIIGLSSNILLRTCFRVGEAIRQSCQAVKAGNNIVIELYARVLNSKRDDLQQRFTFCDLFHAKPPYVQATYAAAIWKTVQLFEHDSARLLQQGRICRCMGTMKRDGKEWVMTILNIWEATWDDVKWIEGIVDS